MDMCTVPHYLSIYQLYHNARKECIQKSSFLIQPTFHIAHLLCTYNHCISHHLQLFHNKWQAIHNSIIYLGHFHLMFHQSCILNLYFISSICYLNRFYLLLLLTIELEWTLQVEIQRFLRLVHLVREVFFSLSCPLLLMRY